MLFKKLLNVFKARKKAKTKSKDSSIAIAKQRKDKQVRVSKRPEPPNGDSLKWEKLKTTQYELLPIEQFTSELLPPSLYKYALNNAARLDNAPIEYIAVALIGALSALLGNSIRIKPKLRDKGWLESLNLWGLIIGNPSTKKTPCLKVGMSPIKYLQEGEDGDSFRFIINDSTYEAACVKAELNPNGILMLRDEIAGWLEVLDRSDRAQERAFYLEGYSVTDYEQIRISRDNVLIEDLTISILGGTQPTKLLNMLRARADGTNNDGLFERFQLAVFPNTKLSQYVDIEPDERLQDDVNRIFKSISKLRTPGQYKVFCFEEQAQEDWNKWASELKNLENSSNVEEQTVLGKYPALCGKIALILHLVSEAENHQNGNFTPSTRITKESLNMAKKWVKLLWSHNKRIQHFGEYYSREDKAELFLKRLSMVKKEPFSLRDVYRGAMHGLKKAHEAHSGANALIEAGYLQTRTVQVSENNKTVWYYRHPDLIAKINNK